MNTMHAEVVILVNWQHSSGKGEEVLYYRNMGQKICMGMEQKT